MAVRLVVDARCDLGEGPLWHAGRGELFWFDINGPTLFACDAEGGGLRRWSFDEPVSAAAVIDGDTLLIASASALWRFDCATGERSKLAALEADNVKTRSNDGRADPYGGFWIGTMGRRAEQGLGSLYRFRRGALRRLRQGITIPNSVAFAPDGRRAYFADSRESTIYRWDLDPATGLPAGRPEVFVHLAEGEAAPDGSVVDADGFLWNAQWDGWRVARYAPDGSLDRIVEVPVQKPSCPAFGGADLRTLYLTSAREGLTDKELAAQPHAGGVFAFQVETPGRPEPRVEI